MNVFVEKLQLKNLKSIESGRNKKVLRFLSRTKSELLRMKKIVMVLLSVLVLLLAGCRDGVDNDTELVILTEWMEMFEYSFYDFFGANEPETLGGVRGGIHYRHPTDEKIMLIFSFFHELYDTPNVINMPINRFMNRESTSVAELRDIFGDDFTVYFGGESSEWLGFLTTDNISAIFRLGDETDENITWVNVRTTRQDINPPEVAELEIITDWLEMFEFSFYDFFGDDRPEEWFDTGWGRFGVRHPVYYDIILMFGHVDFQYLYQENAIPSRLSLPINRFMNRESTSVAELRDIFGENLDVSISEYNGQWMGWLSTDYFGALFRLEHENDENITRVEVGISREELSNEQPDYTELLLEEFGEIIVTAGEFWQDWWNFDGRFDNEHIDEEERLGRFVRLLPSSGFGSLDDIRNYLLQFHTENWVDLEMADEWFPFREYDGMLYIDDIRIGSLAIDWRITANHTSIEYDNDHIVIQTIAHPCWWMDGFCDQPGSLQGFSFTFIDGRIDFINGRFRPYAWYAGVDEDGDLQREVYYPLTSEWELVGKMVYSEQDNEWHLELTADTSGSHRLNADGTLLHSNGGGIWSIIDGGFLQQRWLYHTGRPVTFEVDGDFLFTEVYRHPYMRNKYIRVSKK